jgi:hypothetical protein
VPSAETRRHGIEIVADKGIGLHPFHGRARGEERSGHIGKCIEGKAPEYAVYQGIGLEPKKLERHEKGNAKQAVFQHLRGNEPFMRNARQQHRISPDREPREDADHRARAARAAPKEAAKKRRRELGDRSKGQ